MGLGLCLALKVDFRSGGTERQYAGVAPEAEVVSFLWNIYYFCFTENILSFNAW